MRSKAADLLIRCAIYIDSQVKILIFTFLLEQLSQFVIDAFL